MLATHSERHTTLCGRWGTLLRLLSETVMSGHAVSLNTQRRCKDRPRGEHQQTKQVNTRVEARRNGLPWLQSRPVRPMHLEQCCSLLEDPTWGNRAWRIGSEVFSDPLRSARSQ